jgi:hypothetical protein
VTHQQDQGKNLRRNKELASSKPKASVKKKASRQLTQQHFANRFDYANKKGVAFFKMCDLGY